MSTVSQIERAHAAAGAVINPGGDAAGARAGDRATHLAAAEAAAAMAAETIEAQAAVAAVAALHAEMEREPEPAGGSRSPVGRRRQSGIVVAAGAPWCYRRSTATPERERHGRCSPSRTTTSGTS